MIKMPKKWIFLGLTVSFLLSGCITAKKPNEVVELKKQVRELQKTVGRQAGLIEEQSSKISLLSDRLDHSQENQLAVAQAAVPPAKKTAPLKVQVSPPQKIFAQALIDAKNGDLVKLERKTDMLVKTYNKSPLTSEALSLTAQTFFEKGQYFKAAQQFERLFRHNPSGKNAVVALYGLGRCYNKLGNKTEAREAFESVIKIYPKTPQAHEAARELKFNEAVKQ